MSVSCHVLLIEDEPLVAVGIAMVLEEAGATSIDMAATEREAVAMAFTRRPDVIISDVRLAEGLGPAAVAAICRRYGEVPTVYVTGNPDLCPLDQIQERAPVAVLTKPFRENDLVQAFSRAQA